MVILIVGIAVKPPSPQILDGQWRCDPGDSFEVKFICYSFVYMSTLCTMPLINILLNLNLIQVYILNP